MKQRRLAALLAVMLGLLALRWLVPPGDHAAGDVSQAIARPVVGVVSNPAGEATVAASRAAVARSDDAVLYADASAGTRELDGIESRNAFAVRLPPAPVTPQVPPAPPPPKPFVGPPLPPPVVPPPPPPPPPLQVIGSWRDEQGASVFVASPRGVLQGRVGDTLLAEYRITQITPQQVLLKHLATNRDIPLAVPAGAGPSLTASK
jgi:hypothetical protein